MKGPTDFSFPSTLNHHVLQPALCISSLLKENSSPADAITRLRNEWVSWPRIKQQEQKLGQYFYLSFQQPVKPNVHIVIQKMLPILFSFLVEPFQSFTPTLVHSHWKKIGSQGNKGQAEGDLWSLWQAGSQAFFIILSMWGPQTLCWQGNWYGLFTKTYSLPFARD